jgi:L-fuconolactonase
MPLGAMTVGAMRRWIEHAIGAFGVDRCMFASNFPVDGMHGSLDELWSVYDELARGFDEADRDKLFADNAERVYRL